MSDDRAHLRPVPAPGTVNEAVARETALPDEQSNGLIPPTKRGGGARFISDVISELGFVPAERVHAAVEEAKSAGRTPEELLVDAGDLTAEQLARAIAERFGLDFVDLSDLQDRSRRAEPGERAGRQALQRSADRLRRERQAPARGDGGPV